MFGCPGPCGLPSSTGATAQGTRHRRSRSLDKSGGAGDGGTNGRWHQRPGGLVMTGQESARGDALALGGPNPRPLMANTEGGGGAQAIDPRCSPQQAMTP